jgi:hypothetical protein
MKSFNYEQYFSMNFFSVFNYKTLIDYINDQNALKLHIDSFEFVNEKGQVVELQGDRKNVWYHNTKSDIFNAIDIMNNQLIVYMTTIVESAIDDFFCCIFIKEPNRMLSLRDQECLGFSFSDFLKYNSKEEYINEIATRASSYCNSGRIMNVIRRIKDVTGLVIEESLIKVLIEITNLRNEIVHEGKQHEITYEILKVYSNTIDILLRVLSSKLHDLQIDIIDNGNLLGFIEIDYEEFFEEVE